MNERIKELAEQAGFNPYNYSGGNTELFEKFAELIIKECEIALDSMGNRGQAYNLIKQHFGL